MSELWLSADDVAAHLGVIKDAIYTWITGPRCARPQDLPTSEGFSQ